MTAELAWEHAVHDISDSGLSRRRSAAPDELAAIARALELIACPTLSAEYIIKANPDLIFLADTKCCQQNATTVAARPGWATLTAVHDNDVVALDDDIASRWGPRTPDLLAAIVTALTKLP